MATMLDRGRPLSLWGCLWKAIQPLRPAFANPITFIWFATVVARMIVRVDLLGVTSIVRALNLRPELYHARLRPFHSSAVKLDRLTALWAHTVWSKISRVWICRPSETPGLGPWWRHQTGNQVVSIREVAAKLL
jgi:hypothetical protein